jgi:hypothetical protein
MPEVRLLQPRELEPLRPLSRRHPHNRGGEGHMTDAFVMFMGIGLVILLWDFANGLKKDFKEMNGND